MALTKQQGIARGVNQQGWMLCVFDVERATGGELQNKQACVREEGIIGGGAFAKGAKQQGWVVCVCVSQGAPDWRTQNKQVGRGRRDAGMRVGVLAWQQGFAEALSGRIEQVGRRKGHEEKGPRGTDCIPHPFLLLPLSHLQTSF